jgi:hypothetical protein
MKGKMKKASKGTEELPFGGFILETSGNTISYPTPKGRGYLGDWFNTLWFDKSLLILNGNINKNYFPIRDFVLLITTSNVVWGTKM